MKEEFIPYKQAFDLKEAGFNESCFGYCTTTFRKDIIREGLRGCVNSSLEPHEIALPLYQQVFKWFRNVHGLIGYIQTSYITSNTIRHPNIPCVPRIEFVFGITDKLGKNICSSFGQKPHKKQEDAEIECIKKLIETLKK